MTQEYSKLEWTEHSKIKMRQYALSKQKLLSILRNLERKEKGIAPGTEAVMKTNPGSRTLRVHNGAGKIFFNSKKTTINKAWNRPKRAPGEVWIMYKDVKKKREGTVRRIISAWRYPGVSKPGEAIPIPDDIRRELLHSTK